jgi:hypothetical protein
MQIRGPAAASTVERSSSMKTRTFGQLALFAGLTWTALSILFIPFGDEVWTGRFGVVPLLATFASVIAFSAVALGLAFRFPDRVGPLAPLGAILVTAGAVGSMFGNVMAMAVGSLILMWDLARSGVVPWPLSIAHIAAAVVLLLASVVWQPGTIEVSARALFVAVLAPYVATWIALGVFLLRGGASPTRPERLSDRPAHGATETPA